MSSAGKFEIEVGPPHPVWCRITYGEQEIHGIKHTELHDLRYAIERAIVEARAQLPESFKREMD